MRPAAMERHASQQLVLGLLKQNVPERVLCPRKNAHSLKIGAKALDKIVA